MKRLLTAFSAAALLAGAALATPANANETHAMTAVKATPQDFSARHYYHHRHYRHYGYHGGYYGAPYYAYEPAPYYYGRPYYNPAPFPFSLWPFW